MLVLEGRTEKLKSEFEWSFETSNELFDTIVVTYVHVLDVVTGVKYIISYRSQGTNEHILTETIDEHSSLSLNNIGK